MPIPTPKRYRVKSIDIAPPQANFEVDPSGRWCEWSEVEALLLQRAQEIAELSEEFDRLFQAVEGYRCGSLNRDGLMHYYEIARQFLIALSGPAGGARGEADARERDAGTPQSTGALDPARGEPAAAQLVTRVAAKLANDSCEGCSGSMVHGRYITLDDVHLCRTCYYAVPKGSAS